MLELTKEERLLLAIAEDKKDAALEKYILSHTEFLDLRQQSILKNEFKYENTIQYYGGYQDAERCMAVFIPEYIEGDIDEYFKENPDEDPVCWLRIKAPKNSRKLTHRDYLGSLMGLGIKREKTGDIIVREDGADIAIMKDISDFLLLNYEKAGKVSLKLQICAKADFEPPVQEFKVITDTVSSLRLDSVLSSAFGISRAKAQEAVRRGIVYVNSMQIEKTDFKINENDRLVIRGMGKARLREIGGKSRKDRLYIKIERYI